MMNNGLPTKVRELHNHHFDLTIWNEFVFRDDQYRSQWNTVLRHCSFDYMEAHASKSVPLGGAFWHGGAQTFIYKGNNGRWREELSTDDIARYEQRAVFELGSNCAHWLATGESTGL
ncbi:hypothetical protein [uncultured Shewanella sp.]|uniref:hypothetical protein n=1 Tax=uncultured Shewanella sp. TaxID=173975 RepID=UPI002626BA48|nr:hypothetical protein [uncultured Shewanella sp.]